MISLSVLPTVNACLNATSACLLVTGFFFIKKAHVKLHRIFMLCAFVTSTLFLGSYLTYHFFHGRTSFPGVGWPRVTYFIILISHTILAIVIVPLVLRTLFLAIRRRDEEHKRLARWTLPLWLYVSVTGVIVYLMLYRVDWALGCPACKEALSSSGETNLAQGFNRSIFLMASAPYLLFAAVTCLIVRSVRRHPKRS